MDDDGPILGRLLNRETVSDGKNNTFSPQRKRHTIDYGIMQPLPGAFVIVCGRTTAAKSPPSTNGAFESKRKFLSLRLKILDNTHKDVKSSPKANFMAANKALGSCCWWWIVKDLQNATDCCCHNICHYPWYMPSDMLLRVADRLLPYCDLHKRLSSSVSVHYITDIITFAHSGTGFIHKSIYVRTHIQICWPVSGHLVQMTSDEVLVVDTVVGVSRAYWSLTLSYTAGRAHVGRARVESFPERCSQVPRTSLYVVVKPFGAVETFPFRLSRLLQFG